jgi:hypothetical protein
MCLFETPRRGAEHVFRQKQGSLGAAQKCRDPDSQFCGGTEVATTVSEDVNEKRRRRRRAD